MTTDLKDARADPSFRPIGGSCGTRGDPGAKPPRTQREGRPARCCSPCSRAACRDTACTTRPAGTSIDRPPGCGSAGRCRGEPSPGRGIALDYGDVREPPLNAELGGERDRRREEVRRVDPAREVRARGILRVGSAHARELEERGLGLERDRRRDVGEVAAEEHGPIIDGEERTLHQRPGGSRPTRPPPLLDQRVSAAASPRNVRAEQPGPAPAGAERSRIGGTEKSVGERLPRGVRAAVGQSSRPRIRETPSPIPGKACTPRGSSSRR